MSALDVEALLDSTANAAPADQNGSAKSKDNDDRHKNERNDRRRFPGLEAYFGRQQSMQMDGGDLGVAMVDIDITLLPIVERGRERGT